MKTIGFPGLGLEFNINSTAFTLFGLDIQWYGVILAIGITCAFLFFYFLGTKKEQLDPDTIYNTTLLVVPLAVVGARFFYVITKWDYYKDKSFFDMINLRAGGIAIYGAIIFGLATVLIYCKIKKRSAFSMLDALAPAVMLGQTIGRWGNFVNGEAYGWTEGVEDLPWRMWLERVYVDGQLIDSNFVHPTFLYESLWNLIGLTIILFVLYRKKKFDGEIFFAYLGWYGLGRAFIESIRADSLYIAGNLKFSVFVGVACVIAAVIGIIVLNKRHKEEVSELSEYKSAFEAVKVALSNETDSLDQSVFDTEAKEGSDADDTDIINEEEIDDDDAETLREQDMLDGDAEEADESSEQE